MYSRTRFFGISLFLRMCETAPDFEYPLFLNASEGVVKESDLLKLSCSVCVGQFFLVVDNLQRVHLGPLLPD